MIRQRDREPSLVVNQEAILLHAHLFRLLLLDILLDACFVPYLTLPEETYCHILAEKMLLFGND